jgi:hypothetical protein
MTAKEFNEKFRKEDGSYEKVTLQHWGNDWLKPYDTGVYDKHLIGVDESGKEVLCSIHSNWQLYLIPMEEKIVLGGEPEEENIPEGANAGSPAINTSTWGSGNTSKPLTIDFLISVKEHHSYIGIEAEAISQLKEGDTLYIKEVSPEFDKIGFYSRKSGEWVYLGDDYLLEKTLVNCGARGIVIDKNCNNNNSKGAIWGNNDTQEHYFTAPIISSNSTVSDSTSIGVPSNPSLAVGMTTDGGFFDGEKHHPKEPVQNTGIGFGSSDKWTEGNDSWGDKKETIYAEDFLEKEGYNKFLKVFNGLIEIGYYKEGTRVFDENANEFKLYPFRESKKDITSTTNYNDLLDEGVNVISYGDLKKSLAPKGDGVFVGHNTRSHIETGDDSLIIGKLEREKDQKKKELVEFGFHLSNMHMPSSYNHAWMKKTVDEYLNRES